VSTGSWVIWVAAASAVPTLSEDSRPLLPAPYSSVTLSPRFEQTYNVFAVSFKQPHGRFYRAVQDVVPDSLDRWATCYSSTITRQVEPDYSLNLSILVSEGKETNKDFPSNGE
jgi:hypothetical protein